MSPLIRSSVRAILAAAGLRCCLFIFWARSPSVIASAISCSCLARRFRRRHGRVHYAAANRRACDCHCDLCRGRCDPRSPFLAESTDDYGEHRPGSRAPGASLAESLPSGVWQPKEKPILLSDDPFRLYALRWELEKQHRATNFVLVDTTGLQYPTCQRFLHRSSPGRWPGLPPEVRPDRLFENQTLKEILILLSQRGPIYYLHPSFGYYFEYFYQVPSKLIYALHPYPTNSISAPPMTPEAIQQQDAFWGTLRPRELDPLIGKVPPFVPPNMRPRNRKNGPCRNDGVGNSANVFPRPGSLWRRAPAGR
jgi:hypothetical protein